MAKRARLTGVKTKARLKEEAYVKDQRANRSRRQKTDTKLTGGPVEDDYSAEIPVDFTRTDTGVEAAQLASDIVEGKDIDVSDPDYISEQFDTTPDYSGGFSDYKTVSDYLAEKDSGFFMPNFDPNKPFRRGTSINLDTAADELPDIRSGSVAEAIRTQQTRLAGEMSKEGPVAAKDVIPVSADRPSGFGKPRTYSVASVAKRSKETEAKQLRKLAKDVVTADYFTRTRPSRRGLGEVVGGPHPGEKSAAEARAWKPTIKDVDSGPITFPTASDAHMSRQLAGAFAALYGHAAPTREEELTAIGGATKDVQRRQPLYTKEGYRITPNPDNPREPYILDPDTDEGALREVVARRARRGKKLQIAEAPQAKTPRRRFSGKRAKEAEAVTGALMGMYGWSSDVKYANPSRIVNPAPDATIAGTSAVVYPADSGGSPYSDVLEQNRQAYRKSLKKAGKSDPMKGMSLSEYAQVLGYDEKTQEAVTLEQRSAPLGAKAFTERVFGRVGGPRIGGVETAGQDLINTSSPVPYKFEEGPATRRWGRAMPTPTEKGIRSLAKRNPRSAAFLEAGMYKGTMRLSPEAAEQTAGVVNSLVGMYSGKFGSQTGADAIKAQGDIPEGVIRWEQGEVPPWREGTRGPNMRRSDTPVGTSAAPVRPVPSTKTITVEGVGGRVVDETAIAKMNEWRKSQADQEAMDRAAMSAPSKVTPPSSRPMSSPGGAMKQSTHVIRLSPTTGEWERVAKTDITDNPQFSSSAAPKKPKKSKK